LCPSCSSQARPSPKHNTLLFVLSVLAIVPLAVLLIASYGLGMLFSLKTHREFFR
jgi:Ca2+/H+ antiporter